MTKPVPIPIELVDKIKELVAGVEVDLDAPLPPEEDDDWEFENNV